MNRMDLVRRILGPVLGLAVLLSPVAAADKDKNDPEQFFSTLGERSSLDVGALRAQLLKVKQECTHLEKRCPASDDLFNMVSGDLHVKQVPMHVIYIDANFEVQVNKLFWRGRLTPYVWGAQSLGLIVLSDAPLDCEARLINLYSQPGGVTAGLRNLVVSEGRRTMDAREASENTKQLDLKRLSGSADEDALWGDATQFYLDTTTSYRLSVLPIEESVGETPKFTEIQARFSNSTGQSIDLGVGLGLTFDLDPQELEGIDGAFVGDSAYVNLYWLITAYIKKPVLVKPIAGTGAKYRPSYGVTVGLNLAFWDPEEFVLGFNLGHLYGRHGIVVGVNWIDPDGVESEAKPFFAFDFKF